MRKMLILMLVSCLVVVGGCSLSSEGPDRGETPEESFQAADDIDGMLKEGPGKFAGDRYDEPKLKKELEALPGGLSAEEAYNHLIRLLAEDYGPVVKEIENFRPALDVGNLEGSEKDSAGKQEKPDYVNISILLDASGSMAGRVDGKVKMDLAKEAIREFVSNLPENSRVSLRVYGHKGSNSKKDKAISCKSTEEVYSLGEYDESRFSKALDRFVPTGWTPLASAIQGAQRDLSAEKGENVKNVVYVVSDGIETCGGDPVKAARALHESDIKAIVNIIGFDVDNAGQRALKKVAEAGGGKYTTVSSGEDLRRHLEGEYTRLRIEWRSWGVESSLDAQRQWGDKREKLGELTTLLSKKNREENNRMLKAKNYLQSKGKLSDTVGLSRKIDDRWLKINKYKDERHLKLAKILRNERDKEQRRVKEKAQEMEDHYN